MIVMAPTVIANKYSRTCRPEEYSKRMKKAYYKGFINRKKSSMVLKFVALSLLEGQNFLTQKFEKFSFLIEARTFLCYNVMVYTKTV